MATLAERFEQAVTVRRMRESPPIAQQAAVEQRLDALEREATEGSPERREAAMRQFIELLGDMQQQDA
jgi:hypothetical protein